MTSSTGDVIRVTAKGQATIPKALREQFGIEAPGRVRIHEEDGKIVVEPVPSASEMRGFAARRDATTDEPATTLLREKRERDRAESDQQG